MESLRRITYFRRVIMESIHSYNQAQVPTHREICEKLEGLLSTGISQATSKLWHGHPVWFIDDNPIVGYSVQKAGVRLMFWSGASFDEPLLIGTSKFKDASIFYNFSDEIDDDLIMIWLDKAQRIQWDYKNIVKRKGVLERLK